MSVSTGELIDSLRKANKTQQAIIKTVKAVERLETNPVNNAHEMRRALSRIQEASALLSNGETAGMLDKWKGQLTERLEDYVAENKRAFGTNLESLLRDKGIQLAGRYPHLRAGIYTIELDFDRAGALIWYGPKEELMARSKLTPAAVVAELEHADESLTRRPIDASSSVEFIYGAYQTVLSKMAAKQGDRVPILKVLVECVVSHQKKNFVSDPKKQNFTEYTRAHFSYDLYRVGKGIACGQELLLVPATRATAGKRESYLWVPRDADGNGDRCAYLCFRGVK